jgi:uncharacterized protein
MVYRTPGVYIEEIPKFPPSVAQVETAIPVFIGYTEKARLDGRDVFMEPQRISSHLEFQEIFGDPQREENIVVTFDIERRGTEIIREIVTADFDWDNGGAPSRHVMYYALQSYFANGGGPCWIISVGPYLAYGTTIPSTLLTQGLEFAGRLDEPTLTVFPEGQSMDVGEYHALMQAAMLQAQRLGDRFVIMDIHQTGRAFTRTQQINDAVQEFRDAIGVGVDLAKYGATYFPGIRSTADYVFNQASVIVRRFSNRQPESEGAYGDLDNRDQAKANLAIQKMSIYLPASPTVAGIYARVDNTRGVWKAPANEGVMACDGINVNLNDQQQEGLNVDNGNGYSVNVIRKFVGRGIRVWGARTLAGNDNEWRYISVRRFFNMVEESVKKSTYQFVFEPNDANTWIRIKGMIENFLLLQWRAGALQGATPEKAFFVKVGLGETMTALDILEGRLIVEIGMAVVRPAEFIILRFMHKLPE